MTRLDKLGISSVTRSMSLRPGSYESMMHFFRAGSWSLDEVRRQWYDAVKAHIPTFCIFGRYILVGDGVKQSKEGHYMPGVKRMAQESETQSKPEHIHGHMWGCIGILTGTIKSLACTPLFQEYVGEFMPMTIRLYGKKQDIRYYDTVLLWGQGFYQKLRFVLVEYGNTKSILVSTDLTVSPLSIIHLYSYRARIENSFRTLKQDMGGFAYHFWTKAMGRLNHFKKKHDPDPLEGVLGEHDRQRILDTIRATEMYALMSNISIGIRNQHST